MFETTAWALLEAVVAIQRSFLLEAEPRWAFDRALDLFLQVSGSEYGFIGEVLSSAAGKPFLRTYAITNIAWNEQTRARYDEKLSLGFDFENLGTLYGEVIRTGKAVISNRPQADPRSCGLPPGHPPMDAFLGLPLEFDGRLVGMLGLANRPGGYDERQLAEWRVLCDACAAMVVASQQKRQRDAAQAALDERTRFIERVADLMPSEMYVFDLDERRALFANRGAAEAATADPRDAMHADDVPRFERHLNEVRELTDGEVAEFEYLARDADGNRRWMHSRDMAFHRTPDGRVDQIVGLAIDVTERKRAEEELAARRTELLHAARLSAMGEMVAALSHEVAQPLSAIGNFAAAGLQALATGDAAEADALTEYLRAIADQNKRCGDFVARLRDFGRRATPQRGPCDVNRLLLDSVALLAAELRRHNIRLHCDLDVDLPALRGDRVQLQQAIVNLLANARDAVRCGEPERRRVAIRSRGLNGGIAIEVEDQGVGLAADVASRLFEPFFTTKENGMGLGLSICHTIVSDHGGRIEAIPNAACGATFRVWLPLLEEGSDG